MSSIGSGPGLGAGPSVEPAVTRRLATSPARAVGSAAPAAPAASDAAAMVATRALDAGAMPVDAERVATIKKAIEENRYPVVPLKVSDALIAAGLLLRVTK